MIINSWIVPLWVVAFFAHGLICATAAALIAGAHNRNRVEWALWGFTFGLFAVLAAAVLGEATQRDPKPEREPRLRARDLPAYTGSRYALPADRARDSRPPTW